MTPDRCTCGSPATVREGDDEPGEWWCGCVRCGVGLASWPAMNPGPGTAREAAIAAWNLLIEREARSEAKP